MCLGSSISEQQQVSAVSSPENVPEKTPGAWFTKLSMTAPGLRERADGPVGVAVAAAVALGLLALQLAYRDTQAGKGHISRTQNHTFGIFSLLTAYK